MLYTVVLVLIVLWALGLATSYTLGGLIHVLLPPMTLLAFRGSRWLHDGPRKRNFADLPVGQSSGRYECGR